ncbi:hypothetical protein [Actinoallomurus bryophytorum]|nr:hypothetical protein [Actinoallomurus bryophytorum]
MAVVDGLPAHAGPPTRALPAAGVNTGVDGFAPNLYTTVNGQIRQAWVLAHHGYAPEDTPKVSCIDVDTGDFCTDATGNPTTWPKPLNTTPKPLGSGNTGDLSTTQAPNGVIQTDAARVLRFPVITQSPNSTFSGGSVGIGCLNMQLQANCQYAPLAPLTTQVGSNINGISGLVAISNRIYAQLTNGRMACYDVASALPCPGQPFTTNSPPSNDLAGLGPSNYSGSVVGIRNRIYTMSNGLLADTNTSPHMPTLTCFDPATNAPCANWTTRVISNPAVYQALAVFPSFNPQGAETGLCAVTTKRTPGVLLNCFDFNGNDALVPAGLLSIFPSTGTSAVVFPPTVTQVNGTQRSYFPFYTQDNVHKGGTACYNWNAQAPCTGFANPRSHPLVNGGLTHDYGYAYNPQNNCMYGMGHYAYMFSFQPDGGAAPC